MKLNAAALMQPLSLKAGFRTCTPSPRPTRPRAIWTIARLEQDLATISLRGLLVAAQFRRSGQATEADGHHATTRAADRAAATWC